jgi:hypothetical protein
MHQTGCGGKRKKADGVYNSQAGGPPPVGYLQLLIQYIHSYLPHLETFSSIHNLRMCHDVVMRAPLNIDHMLQSTVMIGRDSK